MYITFDERCFPQPCQKMADLGHKLRHGTDNLTSGERMVCASIISAYKYLTTEATQKDRNHVCKKLKEEAVE